MNISEHRAARATAILSVIGVTPMADSDDGFVITMDDGSSLSFGYSSCEGDTFATDSNGVDALK